MTEIPDQISFDVAQAAVRALGITDLDRVREVRIRPNFVEVTLYVLNEDGEKFVDADGPAIETRTVPVVLKSFADADLRAELADRFDAFAAAMKPGESR